MATPKWLLHHKHCQSALADFGPDGRFFPVLDDPTPHGKRLVFCTGKIYYQLLHLRRAQRAPVALVRLEQLSPFPFAEVEAALARHAPTEVVWSQEEPRNMGAFAFVEPRLRGLLERRGAASATVRYIGRPESASPATGSFHQHQAEQQEILRDVLRA